MKIFILLLTLTGIQCLQASCKPQAVTLLGQDPISGEDFTVSVTRFGQVKKAESGLIILPENSEENYYEKKYAKSACKKGAVVYLLRAWSKKGFLSVPNFYSHQEEIDRALQAYKIVLEQAPSLSWSTLSEGINASLALFATGTFEEIKKIALISGGVNYPEILLTSNVPRLSRLRTSRMGLFRINESEYLKRLKSNIHTSAKGMAHILNEKKIFMVKSTHSEIVKLRYQNELEDLILPENISSHTVNVGEKFVKLICLIFKKRKMIRFLTTFNNKI